MTLNDEELGRQAVSMYAYLVKSEVDINVRMTIPCELVLGDTIEYRIANRQKLALKSHAAYDNYFYSDQDVSELMTIENFLTRCDSTDINIISGIMNNLSCADIGERLCISENAVKYRVRRMLTIVDVESKNEFRSLMQTYCVRIAQK